MNTQNKLYFYRIEASFRFNDATLDRNILIRARDINDAFELFLDNHFVDKKDVTHYKIVCEGDLQHFGFNPYVFGKCNWQVFNCVRDMPVNETIKISSVKSRLIRDYSEKTIGDSLRRLEHDGYIKCESINSMGEKIYIKKGQVKE